MKHYYLRKDKETNRVLAEVIDHGQRYPLQHFPFHGAEGFALDAFAPGTADLAIAILADWFGEHPSVNVLRDRYWECLALYGDFVTRFFCEIESESVEISHGAMQEFLVTCPRYIRSLELPVSAIACDNC